MVITQGERKVKLYTFTFICDSGFLRHSILLMTLAFEMLSLLFCSPLFVTREAFTFSLSARFLSPQKCCVHVNVYCCLSFRQFLLSIQWQRRTKQFDALSRWDWSEKYINVQLNDFLTVTWVVFTIQLIEGDIDDRGSACFFESNNILGGQWDAQFIMIRWPILVISI